MRRLLASCIALALALPLMSSPAAAAEVTTDCVKREYAAGESVSVTVTGDLAAGTVFVFARTAAGTQLGPPSGAAVSGGPVTITFTLSLTGTPEYLEVLHWHPSPSYLIGKVFCAEPPPALPTTTADCKNGGWESYARFKSQGDCVSFVATKGKNAPAN